MGKGAQIGFHSASDATTGVVRGAGDALIGAYLNKIGLPERAIIYLTSAAPSEIQWLTAEDAKKLGIDVDLFTLPTNSAPAPAPEPFKEYPTASSPSPAKPPVVSDTGTNGLTSEQMETANRLARNFYVRYKATGTAGLSQSIQTCYSQATAKRKVTSLIYCIALDNLTSDIDSDVTAQLKAAQMGFYKIESVRQRALAAVTACDMQNIALQIYKLAGAIDRQAQIDLNRTATQSPALQPAAPVAVAPQSPSTALDSAGAVNESCSRQADALGLHGLSRKDFRERCKTQPAPAQ
jgi:hypothetical protein